MGDDLDKRIAEAQAKLEAQQRPSPNAERAKGMSLGFRMATDFVAAVLVGAGLGWGLDELFHSTPWGLVGGILLGFIAGVRLIVALASKANSAGGTTAGKDGG